MSITIIIKAENIRTVLQPDDLKFTCKQFIYTCLYEQRNYFRTSYQVIVFSWI